MAKIKVSVKDKNTLELQEDAHKGDVIDLSQLCAADVSAVSESVKAAARKEVEQDIEKGIQEKIENAKLKLEKELNAKHQDEITKLQVENNKLNIVIDALENHKLKLNVKLLGETLEKHCDIAFEQIRMALPSNVEYGKDTNAAEGSMGDRIYREFDTDGNEILSIMFEMKNEADGTKTKHKNEDFFKELDKDRTQKKCEYAVLVSLLEKDNPIYDGMYTVPQIKYKDMFVIRPQDFTNIIMWLRNVSVKLSGSRHEIMVIKQRNLDFAEIDNNFNVVREKFKKHYSAASEKFSKSIEEIDKMIRGLEKIKESLLGSDKQLRYASEDLEDLTVKKLITNQTA
jgi:hypothetical protein